MLAKSKWVRVSRKEPCPVCQRHDYCTRTTDGKAVKCMRVESDRPIATGGWIHRLTDPLPPAVPSERPKLKNVAALAKKMFFDKLAFAKRLWLADRLRVSVSSLISLCVGIGWDHDGREFSSFPSRDHEFRIIGITRRYDDGEKKTLAGTSNRGLFVPINWWKPEGPIYCVEGASDTAALFTRHCAVLGRPSNTGGVQFIAAYLNRRGRDRRILVVGENDRKANRVGTIDTCKKSCQGCAWCWPGRYGATSTIAQLRRLGITAELLMPPDGIKDAREWLRIGLDLPIRPG